MQKAPPVETLGLYLSFLAFFVKKKKNLFLTEVLASC